MLQARKPLSDWLLKEQTLGITKAQLHNILYYGSKNGFCIFDAKSLLRISSKYGGQFRAC